MKNEDGTGEEYIISSDDDNKKSKKKKGQDKESLYEEFIEKKKLKSGMLFIRNFIKENLLTLDQIVLLVHFKGSVT